MGAELRTIKYIFILSRVKEVTWLLVSLALCCSAWKPCLPDRRTLEERQESEGCARDGVRLVLEDKAQVGQASA